MSWKSFVSAGLLCVLASPAFAAPTLRVINGPALNAQGNWVWNVTIQTSFTDTPVAAEIGFDANRSIVGTPQKGGLFDGANTANPGADIFDAAVDGDWEVYTDVDQTAGVNMQPVGLQVEPIGNDGTINQIFAALGSEANLPNSPTQSTFLTIVTTGPAAGALTGSLQVLGAYGPGGNEARIAEATGATTSSNYRFANSSATRTLEPGDVNLSGVTNGDDVGILAGLFGVAGSHVGGWSIGDFDRDGDVDGDDVGFLAGGFDTPSNASLTNYSQTGVLDPPPGGGSSSVGAVPEPSSIALFGLAVMGGLGLLRRNRG